MPSLRPGSLIGPSLVRYTLSTLPNVFARMLNLVADPKHLFNGSQSGDPIATMSLSSLASTRMRSSIPKEVVDESRPDSMLLVSTVKVLVKVVLLFPDLSVARAVTV